VNTEKKLRMTSSFHSKVERFKTEYHPSMQEKAINVKVNTTDEVKPQRTKSQGVK
jgi:hypothetical protein